MFACRKLMKGQLIERAPVIPINEKQWPSAQRTILSDYAFDWGEHDEHAAIALGYVSIYNHSYAPNAQLEELLDELMMEVIAIRDIQPGEEVTINYNGDPQKQDPLWFTERNSPPKLAGEPRKRRGGSKRH
jgi:SET domain-containing protein